jgi:hypothetical protein
MGTLNLDYNSTVGLFKKKKELNYSKTTINRSVCGSQILSANMKSD